MSSLEIIELVLLICIAVVLGIFYLVKIIKNKWMEELIETIELAMKAAEKKYPKGHGEEKKQMVLDVLKAKCEELSIPYHLLVSLFGKVINKIVDNWNILKK